MTLAICPCGSGKTLDQCCAQYFGSNTAPTAEALMRSRYTAYVLEKYDYLLATWHRDTRPASLGGTNLHWIGLEIVRTEQGSEQDETGVVEFIASYIHPSSKQGQRLHECSRFIREEGRWYYVSGDCHVSTILGKC